MEKGDCLPDERSAVVAIEPPVDVRGCTSRVLLSSHCPTEFRRGYLARSA